MADSALMKRNLALIALSLGLISQASADTLMIQGSTTFARRILEPLKTTIEIETKHDLTVIPNKSLPGLIALIEGRAQMAMISSSLTSEIAALKKVMPGLAYDQLQSHAISATRVAVAVHSSNRVRQASRQQLKQVLLGKIKNWAGLGGANLPMRVVLVGGGGGVTTAIEAELLDGAKTDAAEVIYVKTPIHLVRVVEQEVGAIGFAQLALVKQRGMPELLIDQPIEQTLSYVTMGPPTPPMIDVIQATRRAAEKMF